MIARTLSRVVTSPPPAPGFIGAGHTAVEVVTSDDLAASDPFVLLMDDRLDIPERRKIGGAHPHAGLETVTLLLDGEVVDRDEGPLRTGDALWMSAGRGVIHNEAVETEGRSRILQLWVRLPAADRRSVPSFEAIHATSLPLRREAGAEVRLYSGATFGMVSPTRNHAPITMAGITLEDGASVALDLPASYNGFLVPIAGRVAVGARELVPGQVGWLDRPSTAGESVLTIKALSRSELVLYTGEPQNEPLVHHGPFVAGSYDDVARLFQTYRRGDFERLSEVAVRQARGAPPSRESQRHG